MLLGVLISSYFDQDDLFPEYSGKNVQFDFSEIRPAGSYLSSSSGKAPGAEPLKKALFNIKKILDRALKNSDFCAEDLRKLSPMSKHMIL